MDTISLFSGAGGLDVGVSQAGFNIIAANELDVDACKTYKANHPNCMLFEGDIYLHIEALVKYLNVDLLIGGPPCQGFSVAGKMNFDDPRSKLVFTYCDVVERLKPKAFIMENVKSLGSLNKFQGIREEIFCRMSNAGYTISMVILNAKDFGVPQSRERVFFIGLRGKNKSIDTRYFDKYKEKPTSLREAILHLGRAGTKTNPHLTKAKITLAKKPILRKSPYAGMIFNGQGRPLNPDGWSSTLPASMGGNRTPIIDEDHLYDNKPSWIEEYHKCLLNGNLKMSCEEAPKRLRRLTISEAMILQTFPSSYSFFGSQSKIFTQVGNAVPCKLAKVVALAVRTLLTDDSFNDKHQKQMSLHFDI